MTHRLVRVKLGSPANEMAQEEIRKQVHFLSRGIRGVRIVDADTLEFEADVAPENLTRLAADASALAGRIQRTLRSLQRKIAFKSAAAVQPQFAGMNERVEGIEYEGPGLVVLSGLPLQLWEYLDRRFREFCQRWTPRPLRAPSLIPASVLARCDYFRSFPHSVTFASHLAEDPSVVESFRERHSSRDSLDDRALADMSTPEACLSPALCYHAYYANRDSSLGDRPLVYAMVGKCFRYESGDASDLRRLWDFTMRELVFLGTREAVLAERASGMELFQAFLDEHRIASEIRTASDPFFLAPDSAGKTYFQISAETKFEISMMLPGDARLAVGSFNYHGDFFGRAFNCSVPGGGPMHSVCFGWGLERWVYGILQQLGSDPARWPDAMREAPEFAP